MDLNLIFKDVADPVIRENFFRLQKALLANTVLGPDFTFFEIDVPEPSLSYPILHGLGYAPTDLMMLSSEGDQNFYFRYDQFDKTNIYIAAHGKVRLRFLLGRFPQQGRRLLSEKQLSFVAPNVSGSSGGGLGGSGSDGWAFIQDAQYPQASPLLIPANTRTLIPNNGAGALTNYINAPAAASSWWDSVNYRFWPTANGDFYTFRLNLTAVPVADGATLTLDYDIGTPNLPWSETRSLPLGAGNPSKMAEPIPAPIGTTAFSSGIGFHLTCTCDVAVYGINLTIIRDFKK